jgi:hypothetical protein
MVLVPGGRSGILGFSSIDRGGRVRWVIAHRDRKIWDFRILTHKNMI